MLTSVFIIIFYMKTVCGNDRNLLIGSIVVKYLFYFLLFVPIPHPKQYREHDTRLSTIYSAVKHAPPVSPFYQVFVSKIHRLLLMRIHKTDLYSPKGSNQTVIASLL